MASGSAVRFVLAGRQTPGVGAVCFRLRVKPGTSREREGVSSVLDDCIELCVAAPPRDGEANKAVVRLLSDVVGLPMSRFRLTHGAKARDKTVVLEGVAAAEGPALAERVMGLLLRTAGGG